MFVTLTAPGGRSGDDALLKGHASLLNHFEFRGDGEERLPLTGMGRSSE
jgi:hypothetical protein